MEAGKQRYGTAHLISDDDGLAARVIFVMLGNAVGARIIILPGVRFKDAYFIMFDNAPVYRIFISNPKRRIEAIADRVIERIVVAGQLCAYFIVAIPIASGIAQTSRCVCGCR